MTEIFPINQKRESAPVHPTEVFQNTGVQEALPEILEKLVKEFEQKLSPEGVLDYKGPTPLRYRGMSTSDLIELHHTVGKLESQVKRILGKFIMSEEKLQTLREIARINREILCSEEAVELIKKWEGDMQNPEIKVEDGLSTSLGNQMHDLWENLESLRKQDPIELKMAA